MLFQQLLISAHNCIQTCQSLFGCMMNPFATACCIGVLSECQFAVFMVLPFSRSLSLSLSLSISLRLALPGIWHPKPVCLEGRASDLCLGRRIAFPPLSLWQRLLTAFLYLSTLPYRVRPQSLTAPMLEGWEREFLQHSFDRYTNMHMCIHVYMYLYVYMYTCIHVCGKDLYVLFGAGLCLPLSHT